MSAEVPVEIGRISKTFRAGKIALSLLHSSAGTVPVAAPLKAADGPCPVTLGDEAVPRDPVMMLTLHGGSANVNVLFTTVNVPTVTGGICPLLVCVKVTGPLGSPAMVACLDAPVSSTRS
jgi:hypothetical protein